MKTHRMTWMHSYWINWSKFDRLFDPYWCLECRDKDSVVHHTFILCPFFIYLFFYFQLSSLSKSHLPPLTPFVELRCKTSALAHQLPSFGQESMKSREKRGGVCLGTMCLMALERRTQSEGLGAWGSVRRGYKSAGSWCRHLQLVRYVRVVDAY